MVRVNVRESILRVANFIIVVVRVFFIIVVVSV